MLEVEIDLALEDDKQLVVVPLVEDLILDEVQDLLDLAVIWCCGLALHLDVVEASQLFE